MGERRREMLTNRHSCTVIVEKKNEEDNYYFSSGRTGQVRNGPDVSKKDNCSRRVRPNTCACTQICSAVGFCRLSSSRYMYV